MLPRIAHQIWLGSDPIHPLMLAWRRSWIALHPTWDFRLWTQGSHDHEIVSEDHTFTSSFPNLLDGACHLSQKSNIWRYELVRRYGGLYLDTDVEPLRTIDDLLGNLSAFVVEGVRQYGPVYESAFFGATPNHPWTVALTDHLSEMNPGESLSMGVDYLTKIAQKFPEDVTVLPKTSILFPIPEDWRIASEEGKVPKEQMISPPSNTYAVHHFSSLWYPTGFRTRA